MSRKSKWVSQFQLKKSKNFPDWPDLISDMMEAHKSTSPKSTQDVQSTPNDNKVKKSIVEYPPDWYEIFEKIKTSLQEEMRRTFWNNPSVNKKDLEKKRAVLLIADFRSGSSFTGSLLKRFPGAFYSFEPLQYSRNFYKGNISIFTVF